MHYPVIVNLFLLFIVVVSVIGLRISRRPDTQTYITKAHTTQINGLFILIVFYAHVRTYIELNPTADGWMYGLATHLGQLMVALFLFYSGFGVHESIKHKPGYVHSIPVKRLGVVWVNFASAIVLFLILDAVMGEEVTLHDAALAFVAWTSVGNSAWYIFAILALYLLTYLVYLFQPNKHAGIAAMFVATICLSLVLWWARDFSATYSYNTVVCYPLGMAWSAYRAPLERRLSGAHHWQYWLGFLATTTIAYILLKSVSGVHYLVFQGAALAYCLIAVLVTMVIHFHSPILTWFGHNLFWVYVLQRLPMLALTQVGLAQSHRYIFVVACFIITVILTSVMSRLMAPVTSRMVRQLKNSNK